MTKPSETDLDLLDMAVGVTTPVPEAHRATVERLVESGLARFLSPARRCFLTTPEGRRVVRLYVRSDA